MTRSGKAVQFIQDDGTVYITSVISIQNLIHGSIKGGICKLSQLPFKTDASRFPPSEMFTPAGYIPPSSPDAPDPQSEKGLKLQERKRAYKDENVW